MIVKEIARLAEVNPDTVRFYTREGLLRPQQNPRNGYYVYGSEDLRRLRFIRKGHKLGLSLDEIKVILTQTMNDGLASGDLRNLFAERLSRLEQELDELRRLRDDMRIRIEAWKHMPTGAPDGFSIQELIESWS